MGHVDDATEEKTPTVENPCPQCGSPLVVIGISVDPPPISADVWETIFSQRCVKAPLWRWCREGHLTVRVLPPS